MIRISPATPWLGMGKSKSNEELIYQVQNSIGQIVKTGSESKIDISNEKPGIYILTITTENSTKSFKLIKE